jgi:hypothetical protein
MNTFDTAKFKDAEAGWNVDGKGVWKDGRQANRRDEGWGDRRKKWTISAGEAEPA